jgi:hypothetical protein
MAKDTPEILLHAFFVAANYRTEPKFGVWYCLTYHLRQDKFGNFSPGVMGVVGLQNGVLLRNS